jgi:replicative DNA helicase
MTVEVGLPSDIRSERFLLGAILLENHLLSQAEEKLCMEDFSLHSNQLIFLRMSELGSENRTVDIATLCSELSRHKELESVGGVAYISSLTEGMPRRPVIDEYISIVKDKAITRRVMDIGNSIVARASDQSETGIEVATWGESALAAALGDDNANKDSSIQAILPGVMEEITEEYKNRLTPCIPSGCDWFDGKTGGGYRIGKVTLVAARPGIGKTAWAVQSIVTNCMAGRAVHVFSLEMEREELTRQMIPYVIDVPNIAVKRAYSLNSHQYQMILQDAMEAMAGWKLWIDDGDLDINQICSIMKRSVRNNKTQLGVLDFAQRIRVPWQKNTRERINEASGKLTSTMKHLPAAMLLLSQLRKVNREYANTAPVQDDIKESGNLFEDAYTCQLIHRAIDEETGRLSLDASLNVCKVRGGGSTGTGKAKLNPRMLAFEADREIEREDWYA